MPSLGLGPSVFDSPWCWFGRCGAEPSCTGCEDWRDRGHDGAECEETAAEMWRSLLGASTGQSGAQEAAYGSCWGPDLKWSAGPVPSITPRRREMGLGRCTHSPPTVSKARQRSFSKFGREFCFCARWPTGKHLVPHWNILERPSATSLAWMSGLLRPITPTRAG